LRAQAIINGLVRRDRYIRLSGKTHHGAIPGFELGRLAVDNVSLQRRRRVFGEAIATAKYLYMGETAIRFRSVTPFSVNQAMDSPEG
jgi:hypothetical protein